MNILIVEDSELIRDQLLRIIAQEPQLRVVGAASEEREAIRLILAEKPDAVLLDLALAPGSGIRVLEEIRAAGCKTKVFVLSNYLGRALRQACSLLGISGFYDKNSQVKECIADLSRLLAMETMNPTIECAHWQDAREREVFDDLLHLACLATGAPVAVLRLENTSWGSFVTSVGEVDTRTVDAVISEGASLCGSEIIEITDTKQHERLARQPWQVAGLPVRYLSCVPLFHPTGEKFGAFCIINTRPGPIDANQRQGLKSVLRSIRNEVELMRGIQDLQKENRLRRAAEEQAQHLATHDALTQLPNRVILTDRINQLIREFNRNPQPFAVLFIDLDRFKQINDTHGHQIGDRTLMVAATRLQQSLRTSDTVARLGGDEFVVLLTEFATREDVQRITQKILHALTQPFEAGDLTLQVGASIGIALYPQHGSDFNTLLQHADQAMYRVKKTRERTPISPLETTLQTHQAASRIPLSSVLVRKAAPLQSGKNRGL